MTIRTSDNKKLANVLGLPPVTKTGGPLGDAAIENLAEVEKAARKRGYEAALAKWQEAADNYPAILDELLTAMCQMAAAVEDTESARQELIVLQRQLN
jgi:hypothetical protein